MTDATAKQMEILTDSLKKIKPDMSMGSFMGIEKPAEDAQYSTHALARHLLSQPDRLVAYGCEGIELYEEDLGEPAKAYVPPVLTAEEQARRDAMFSHRVIAPSQFVRRAAYPGPLVDDPEGRN